MLLISVFVKPQKNLCYTRFMKMVKISDEHKKQDKADKINKPNFILTVMLSLIGSITLCVYIFFEIPPKNIQWIILFLLLISYCVTVSFTLIFYKFAKPVGFETPKQIFRKQFKKGLVIGIVIFLLFALQVYFDIL